jgi:hypothetical protein
MPKYGRSNRYEIKLISATATTARIPPTVPPKNASAFVRNVIIRVIVSIKQKVTTYLASRCFEAIKKSTKHGTDKIENDAIPPGIWKTYAATIYAEKNAAQNVQISARNHSLSLLRRVS